MTRNEMRDEQNRIKEIATAQYMDHVISGCRCLVGEYNPYDDQPVCETMQTYLHTRREFQTVRNFRRIRILTTWGIDGSTFSERFCGVFGVIA
jgi:hypothetical protein